MPRQSRKSLRKEAFERELALVTPFLPKYYAVLIQNKHPQIDRTKIYNVRHYGSVDYEVLDAMKELLSQEQLEKVSEDMLGIINN